MASSRRILVIESITSGRYPQADVAPSLLAEGRAMLEALLADLAGIDDLEVATCVADWCELIPPSSTRSHRLADYTSWRAMITSALAECDAAWLIAPELDGELLELVTLARQMDKRLVSPGYDFVALTSDKALTCGVLLSAGVRVPRGGLASDSQSSLRSLRGPLVVKRNDGAGSLDMYVVSSPEELRHGTDQWRVEEYVQGTPASVAVACGPSGNVILGTATQELATDGSFAYRGGQSPLPADLANRAEQLAMNALAALPPTIGYVGVDLMLGDDQRGQADYVIEVNPRLTTSYIGHRATTSANLAQIVLRTADGMVWGRPAVERPVEFDTHGRVISLDS